ncbi:protein artichoke-like [Pollicipes pollicipes]|uniref:protein artichoke-like n=1 Tax=Pollicipes pollicipes TaxID=41117 RepID=UPI001884FC40|nr:protein artichoke-like [Pollicipes pollicipes]
MVDRGAFHGLEDTLTHLVLREPAAHKFAFDALDDLHVLESLLIEQTPLQTLPSLARADRLRLLSINSTGIGQIPSRAFRGAPELRVLHYTFNPTATLGENSLLGLAMLRVANFSFNSIEYIHPRAFFPTQHLDHLSFAGNGVRDASVVTIAAREAQSLRRLDLSGNLIEYVKTGTFVDLKNMEILNLRQNFITKVDQDAFHVLPRLKRLDLTNNYVNSLKKDAFFSMESLEQLLLKQNNITDLTGSAAVLRMLPNLRVLDLSMNLIESVPGNTFAHPALEILYLNHNNIKQVDRNGFKNMPDLRELHMHHNFLVMEQGGSDWWNLPKLTLLDLSFNDMTHLHASVLRNVTQLEHADFSYNIINVVDENAFVGTAKLKFLNLSFNSLPKIYPMTFKNLKELRQVDLSFNELVSVETGQFSSAENLQDLRMKFNKIADIQPNSLPVGNVLKVLDLSYNFIATFPAASLSELRGLSELRMKQNMLRDLPAQSLQKLTKLRELDFGFNMLSKLDPSILKTMSDLRSVELSGNFLKTIPLELFEGNQELRVVNISNNLLTTIPPKTFHNLNHLETLDLRNNTLVEFDNMVNQLPSIRYLDASYNNIRFLSSTTFENTPSLEHLEMHHNYVEHIKSNTFLNMPSLRQLDLSYNAMVEMDPGSFRGDQQLKAIFLNNNNLRQLKEATFVNLNGLERINLQENQLTHLSDEAYENLPALRSYNLSANQLATLPRGTFQRLRGLRTIDLSHNRILEVNDGTFRSLADLQTLKLNDNGMCRIHDDAFAGQRNMDAVYLQNNRIRSLRKPLFRRVRTVLHQLDVSGNPLRCDCEIQWLREWLGDLRARHPPAGRHLHEPICYYPQEMRGVPMLRTRENDFHCERASLDHTEPCPEFTDSELRVFHPTERPGGARRPHQLGLGPADYGSPYYDQPLDSANAIGSLQSAEPSLAEVAPPPEVTALGILGTLGTLGTLSTLLPKLGLTFGLGSSNRNSDRAGLAGGAQGPLPPGLYPHKPPYRPDSSAGFSGGPLFIPAKHGHIRHDDSGDPHGLNAFVFPDPQLNPGAASSLNAVVFDGERRPPARRPEVPSVPETIPMDAPFPSTSTEAETEHPYLTAEDELGDFSLDSLLQMIAEQTTPSTDDQTAGGSPLWYHTTEPASEETTTAGNPISDMLADWFDTAGRETTETARHDSVAPTDAATEYTVTEPATESAETTTPPAAVTTEQAPASHRPPVNPVAAPTEPSATPELDTFAPQHNWNTPANTTYEARLKAELAVNAKDEDEDGEPSSTAAPETAEPRGRPSITMVQPYDGYPLPQFIAPPAVDAANEWYYRNYFSDELERSRPADAQQTAETAQDMWGTQAGGPIQIDSIYYKKR